MINILIVDDSPTDTAILKYLFESASDLHVIACAKNGKEAIQMVNKYKPDLITMDLQMPSINGFEAIHTIMTYHPTPIVVISSVLDNKDLNATFRALEAGALYVLEKPRDINTAEFNRSNRLMLDTLRSMASIKALRKNRFAAHAKLQEPIVKNICPLPMHYEIVAIGTSVGGPKALKTILSSLPRNFPLPIVVVQHMAAGFIDGFASWLNQQTELEVKIAEHFETLLPGIVYIAPDDTHLEVMRLQNALTAKLVKDKPVSGFMPSITVLIRSVAKATTGNAIGMLLTGMGNDGAEGLLELKKAHGHTLVQDADSAVVFGMGAVAKLLGAVDQVVELEKIADYLTHLRKKNE